MWLPPQSCLSLPGDIRSAEPRCPRFKAGEACSQPNRGKEDQSGSTFRNNAEATRSQTGDRRRRPGREEYSHARSSARRSQPDRSELQGGAAASNEYPPARR